LFRRNTGEKRPVTRDDNKDKDDDDEGDHHHHNNNKNNNHMKPMHGQFYWDLDKPSVDKKKPWHGYVAQG
jgi:hypothetical protein